MNDEIWLVIGVFGEGRGKIENPLAAFHSLIGATRYIDDMRQETAIEQPVYRVAAVPLFEGWSV
jgi:hypothetical protein